MQMDTETNASGPSNVEEVGCVTPIKNTEEMTPPHEGMEFESIDQAREYYEEYGRKEGFRIKIRTSTKSKPRSDLVTRVRFACCNERSCIDKNDEHATGVKGRSCNTVKSGCKGVMTVLYNDFKGKWVVNSFKNLHNHKFVSPANRQYMKSRKHAPNAVKALTEAFVKENPMIGKIPNLFGGVNPSFDKKDCYNLLRNVKYKELEDGDAQTVLNHFKKRRLEDPQFFYAIQYDETSLESPEDLRKQLFDAMPQTPHYHPLDKYKGKVREGMVQGLEMAFVNLSEEIRNLVNPQSLWSGLKGFKEQLSQLEEMGFNVTMVRGRLDKLQGIAKREQPSQVPTEELKSDIAMEEANISLIRSRILVLEGDIEKSKVVINNKKSKIEELKNDLVKIVEEFKSLAKSAWN